MLREFILKAIHLIALSGVFALGAVAQAQTANQMTTHTTTKEEVKLKTAAAADAAVEYTKEQKEAAQKEMEANLNALKKQIAELKASANQKSGAVKKDLKKQAAALEVKQKNLRKELTRLKHSSGRAWDEMKNGMSEAIQKLSESYQKAKDNFK